MASQDAPLQEIPGLQPDCMGHHEHSLPSFVTLHDLGIHVSHDIYLQPCIYLEMNQQSVVHEQKLRHVVNEHALLFSLKKKPRKLN